MVLLIVFAFFLLVASTVLLLAFPGLRLRLAALLDGAQRQIGHSTLAASAGVVRSGQALTRTRTWLAGFVQDHRRLAPPALLLLATPSLIALLAGGPALFAFVEETGAPDRQILGLLDGEHLAPPAALPPEVFTTREVELVRPDIVHASRDWALLDGEFAQRLLWVMKTLREQHGYELVLIEGYRSPERQARLAALGPHVTQAGAHLSYHQYGLAADCAFLREGRIVISERDPWAMRGYQLYGQVAGMAGLNWGGRWKMQDYGHVELRRGGPLGRGSG